MPNPTKKLTPAGQTSGLSVIASSVFELIERQQCEDQYFPLGIFRTLEEAVAVVEKYGVNICNNDPDEWAGVEINERKFGLSDNGKTVWKRSWERDWSDDAKDKWKVIVPSSPNTASQRTQPAMSDHQPTEAPTTEPRPGSL